MEGICWPICSTLNAICFEENNFDFAYSSSVRGSFKTGAWLLGLKNVGG